MYVATLDQLEKKTDLCTKQDIIYVIVLQSLKFTAPDFRGNPAKGDGVKGPLHTFQQSVISFIPMTY